MKLITLNIWGGRLREELLEFLTSKSTSLDVLCLQEVLLNEQTTNLSEEQKRILEAVDKHAKIDRPQTPDIYNKIKEKLGGFYSYLSPSYSSGEERLATFVKESLEIKENSYSLMTKGITDMAHGVPFNINSPLQFTKIKNGNPSYNICNVHGLWQAVGKIDTPERIEQSETWIKVLDKLEGKKILCGDFNLLPTTKSISLLEEAGMVNLIKEYDIKSTRSKLTPSTKTSFADYIFVSKDVKVKEFKVIDETVSDHLPLYLDFD